MQRRAAMLWQADCGGDGGQRSAVGRGRLFALTMGPAGGQFAWPLCLVELHPQTGDVLSRQQILEIGRARELPGECQASWAGNRARRAGGGSVIAIDLQGRNLWLRQETALPFAIDPAFIQQHCQPAIESTAGSTCSSPVVA